MFTVFVSTLVHPVERVYVISVVPAVTPVRIPEDEPMVATPDVLLVHDPPVGVVDKFVVVPVHAGRDRVNAAGAGFMVNSAVDWHPVAINLYDIVAVPVEIGVTVPVADPIVAIELLPLIHEPPAVLHVNVVADAFSHNTSVPEIEVGTGFTVTVVVLKQAPLL